MITRRDLTPLGKKRRNLTGAAMLTLRFLRKPQKFAT
jgi:hypothetical protein